MCASQADHCGLHLMCVLQGPARPSGTGSDSGASGELHSGAIASDGALQGRHSSSGSAAGHAEEGGAVDSTAIQLQGW